MKRANKNFLLAEYERYRKKPQSVHINNREIIIPCEYTLGGNAPEVVRKNFLYDYFDLQKREADKYKKAGVAPRLIEFGGVHYIVPFNCRRREIPDTKIVENILRRCEAKYNRAVSLTRKLDKAFPQREYTVEIGAEHVSDMQKAYRAFLLKNTKTVPKRRLSGPESLLPPVPVLQPGRLWGCFPNTLTVWLKSRCWALLLRRQRQLSATELIRFLKKPPIKPLRKKNNRCWKFCLRRKSQRRILPSVFSSLRR